MEVLLFCHLRSKWSGRVSADNAALIFSVNELKCHITGVFVACLMLRLKADKHVYRRAHLGPRYCILLRSFFRLFVFQQKCNCGLVRRQGELRTNERDGLGMMSLRTCGCLSNWFPQGPIDRKTFERVRQKAWSFRGGVPNALSAFPLNAELDNVVRLGSLCDNILVLASLPEAEDKKRKRFKGECDPC